MKDRDHPLRRPERAEDAAVRAFLENPGNPHEAYRARLAAQKTAEAVGAVVLDAIRRERAYRRFRFFVGWALAALVFGLLYLIAG